MKAFVTGASGFLGGSLTRRLVSAGWSVRALVRSDAAAARVESLGAQPVLGDVERVEGWAQALQGVDAVFHTAARVDVVKPDRAAMMRSNVEGTRNVLQAALQAGVPRAVHYSSVAALGRKNQEADETVWHDGDYQAPYEESKHRAEQAALDVGNGTLEIVHILPAVVIGPGDPKSGAFFQRYLRRRMPVRPAAEGGTSFVHVEDVSQGAFLAYEKGRPNERYILSQVTWTMTELFAELESLTGIPPPRKVPTWIVKGIAGLEELRAGLLGRTPRLSRDAVRLATQRRAFSSEKARRELGWRPVDFRQRLRETIAYWQAEVARAG